MRIGRTLPPVAAPLAWRDLWHGLIGGLDRDHAIRTLEEEIRREFDVAHVFLLSSGTAALALTLTALKSLSPGRDVVLPAFTCPSVPAAVLEAGLHPIPCDIDAATFDFDHERLDEAVTGQTLCVIAHHLFGIPSDVERLRNRCHPRGIVVVEDAAQAMGAEAGGRKLGTMGDVGIFSFGRGKNITCGSGGVILTNSDRIAGAIGPHYRRLHAPSLVCNLKALARIALMMVFIRPRLYWIPAALPFLALGETIFPKTIPMTRLAAMQAGLLRGWASRLARSNEIRSRTAAWFRRQLPIRLTPEPPQPYLRLPIAVANAKERARIYSRSRKRGLGLSVGFPAPVNEIPEMRAICHGRRCPRARRVADTILTLPTHQWVAEEDMRAIADLLRDADLAEWCRDAAADGPDAREIGSAPGRMAMDPEGSLATRERVRDVSAA